MSERKREGVPLRKGKDWAGISGNDTILELSELWHGEWEVGDVSVSQLVDVRTYCWDAHRQRAPAAGKDTAVKQQQPQEESFLQALP